MILQNAKMLIENASIFSSISIWVPTCSSHLQVAFSMLRQADTCWASITTTQFRTHGTVHRQMIKMKLKEAKNAHSVEWASVAFPPPAAWNVVSGVKEKIQTEPMMSHTIQKQLMRPRHMGDDSFGSSFPLCVANRLAFSSANFLAGASCATLSRNKPITAIVTPVTNNHIWSWGMRKEQQQQTNWSEMMFLMSKKKRESYICFGIRK